MEFHGERTKDALLNFAEKCAADIVEKVNAVGISEMRAKSKQDPFFIFVGDQQGKLFETFVESAEKLFSKVASPENFLFCVSGSFHIGVARISCCTYA